MAGPLLLKPPQAPPTPLPKTGPLDWFDKLTNMSLGVMGMGEPQPEEFQTPEDYEQAKKYWGAAQLATILGPGTLGAVLKAKGLLTAAPAVAEAGAEAKTLATIGQDVKPLKAFHGSPHDFEQFSSAKIGTGEGAQAYGHGLYFAEKEQIANEYRKKLSKFGSASEMPEDMAKSVELDGKLVDSAKPSNQLTPLERAALAKHYAGGIQQRAIEEAERDLKYLTPGTPAYEMDKATLDALKTNDLTGRVKPVYGRTYEVNLHTSPDELLDWDAPLSQQPTKVQEAWKAAYKARYGREAHLSRDISGAEALNMLGGGDPQIASASLRQAGVPGHRYLDQGSRTTGQVVQLHGKYYFSGSSQPYDTVEAATKAAEAMHPRTRNIVMYPGSEHLIEIAKKYGVTLAVAAEMYRRATQPQMGDIGQ
jgi:hypothetical protein